MNRNNRCQYSVFVAIIALVLGFGSTAQASPTEQAKTLLDQIATGGSGADRLRAADELAKLGPDVVDVAVEFLARERTAKPEERRAVLRSIKADLPDKKGRFRTPRRKEKINRGDDFDWLARLAKADVTQPGYGDVFADVAAIRALAASKSPKAGDAILSFTFTRGLMYRDECGRYLRKMSPYSLPALIIASQNTKKNRNYRRYANYQLDRLNRDDPYKVLNHTSFDPALQLEIVAAYGKSKHREAVAPLIEYSNHGSSPLRKAAREALLKYITGPKPKDAPKKKLQLTGGRLTDEEQPLWLTYREIANFRIRGLYQSIMQEKPPKRTSLAKLAKTIFKRWDEQRNERWNKQFSDAYALAESQKWAEATAAFDRILALYPVHEKRAQMVRAYFEHGRLLARQKSYRQASAAFSKAQGLDPDGSLAQEALANHYAALGRALEAEGKDASAAFRRARIVQAEKPQSSELLPEAAGTPKRRWMLYAGLGGGAGALIFMILGLAIRRR